MNTDTKARRLHAELVSVFAEDGESAIVCTQYTDTMEYLRDFLARELPDVPVASHSGAGGAFFNGFARDAQNHVMRMGPQFRQIRDLALADQRPVELVFYSDFHREGVSVPV